MLNQFYSKKKVAAFLISIFFSFFMFSVVPAFAVEETRPDDKEDDLKIYYSEALGAGEKVYHFTACKKVPAFAPLRCAKKDENTIIFPEQCKDKRGELLKGTIVKGCMKDPQPKDADHLIVDPAGLGKNKPDGCKDDPDKHYPYYAPEYAIVKFGGDYSPQESDYEGPVGSGEDEEKFRREGTSAQTTVGTVQGSIAWHEGMPPPEVVSEIYNAGVVRRAYRTGKCWPWDEIVDEKASKLSEQDKQKIEAERKAAGEQVSKDVYEIANRLRDEGCNNDNSAESPPFALEGDKASPSIVHCSIYERLTGKTGVELFAKYVGAIYRWLGTIVGIVSVLIIVVSGIQISMAGGDTGGIDKAKNRIMQSLLGLAILFLSGLILYTINPGFFTG